MGASKTVRCLLLLVSVVITAIVVVIAAPERIPELKPVSYTHLTLPTNREV